MKDYEAELNNRIAFIQKVLRDAGAQGIVYGNSGGKDSALVGILCKKACPDTLGVLLPCESKRNFEEDTNDGLAVAEQFGIETLRVDLTPVKQSLLQAVDGTAEISLQASANIAPRLRMTTLYAIAQTRNYLVAGTGNRSEAYMGYFTKWGDGACDFNPISDLTVTEIYEFLQYLGAPESIIKKAPSAGLYEGQTDEKEMGVTYQEIDKFIVSGFSGREDADDKIKSAHRRTEHKRRMPMQYGG